VRIVCNSNKLALRLLPCDVFARVAFIGQEAFQFEIEIARRLTDNGSVGAQLERAATELEAGSHRVEGGVLPVIRAPVGLDAASSAL
jgi:hypothetical protein